MPDANDTYMEYMYINLIVHMYSQPITYQLWCVIGIFNLVISKASDSVCKPVYKCIYIVWSREFIVLLSRSSTLHCATESNIAACEHALLVLIIISITDTIPTVGCLSDTFYPCTCNHLHSCHGIKETCTCITLHTVT